VRYPVLDLLVDAVAPEDALETIGRRLEEGGRVSVCAANVHMVMEARRDPTFRDVVNGADLVVPDGMPLVWLARRRGHDGVRRVYGPDLVLLLLERAAHRGWTCFFYGGTEGVAEDMAAAMARRFPGLRVAGAYGPPFRALSPAEDEDDVRRINASGAQLVFVGLGCPKQERWMADHRARLSAPALLGVGAAFDFLTGRVPQAPRWMMRIGLEWLFRLAQEPRRLWRRYLIYNPLFVFYVLRESLGLRSPPAGPPSR
jgi:N-acetylglucosaminyldiphosphoundecaprenol N-acetyl-beta-D-mannosaminyltransferase